MECLETDDTLRGMDEAVGPPRTLMQVEIRGTAGIPWEKSDTTLVKCSLCLASTRIVELVLTSGPHGQHESG